VTSKNRQQQEPTRQARQHQAGDMAGGRATEAGRAGGGGTGFQGHPSGQQITDQIGTTGTGTIGGGQSPTEALQQLRQQYMQDGGMGYAGQQNQQQVQDILQHIQGYAQQQGWNPIQYATWLGQAIGMWCQQPYGSGQQDQQLWQILSSTFQHGFAHWTMIQCVSTQLESAQIEGGGTAGGRQLETAGTGGYAGSGHKDGPYTTGRTGGSIGGQGS
jgi:hypothetical protein